MMNGVTPVYLAVQENKVALVKYLVNHGANLNFKADDGMSAIHVACQNGSLDMIRLLFENYNVNLNARDFNGATPLHYGKKYHHQFTFVVLMLIFLFLKKACSSGDSNLVAYLLSNGARITLDKYGNSPLHDCAIGGHLECARYLISYECDPSLRDSQNMTSADVAESHGHKKFSEELRKIERLVRSWNISYFFGPILRVFLRP